MGSLNAARGLIPKPETLVEPPGLDWCRQWTDGLDQALRSWLESGPRVRAAGRPPVGGDLREGGAVAVVALGSYARRELCPRSDIDLLLLHDGWSRGGLEQLVQQLCYPLWDAGLAVGHAVHTVREAVRSAGERIDTATALMDRRLVAGDPGLLDRLTTLYRRWLRLRSHKLLSELALADESRHHRAGNGTGMLEPDLKAGAGGLRDLHSLRWAAGAVVGEIGLDALVGARYLGAEDHRILAQANGLLLSARCALHLISAGSSATSDVLRLDLQDEVAARLGFADGDDLLHQAGLAMRSVAHIHGRTWPLLLADARLGRRRRRAKPKELDAGVRLVDGLVEVDPQGSVVADPSLGMRAIAAAAGRGVHLGRVTVANLQHQIADAGRLGWDDRIRGAFLTTLRCGPDALPALSDADHIGLLAAHLPEWPRVRGRPQRNPYHRYDLDTHLFHTVAWLRRIAEGELDARHAAIFERLYEPDVLLLGALLHDVGKAWPDDHSLAGARVASRWLIEMGFDQRRAWRVGRLVRLHLLLPDVAQHRDLDDLDEIRAVADQAGDIEILDALLLLSLADSRATGPSAHSAWKDGLLVELHARARRALTGGRRSVVAPPETVIADARRLSETEERSRADLDAFIERPPERYLLVAGPDQVIVHARLQARLGRRTRLVSDVRDGPTAGTATVSVAAAERGLVFLDVAGVLAGHGLPVLEARAFTTGQGVALDWFVVREPSHQDGARARLQRDLARASAGELDIDALVARRERRWDARPPATADLIDASVAFDRGERVTRIQVEGLDGPGVLYRLVRVLVEAGLDITAARVATLGPQVRDVFFVRSTALDTDRLREELRAVVTPGD